ncbi:amino acid permease [Serratia marcescens]|nr:amino acid permease [Serratia marcescens]RTF99453.1 amino acid permease [Serratia marcescens]
MRNETTQLRRGLNARHIRFMALGSAIGTGLFYGSAGAIQLAGPAVLLAYLVGGAAVFMVMRALGEMAVHQPVSGSFGHYASHYLGPLAGFLTGWTYTFEMVIVALADVTAFGIYMGLWFPDVAQWVWVLSIILFIGALNLCSVKVFGELEFWLSLVKVAAIVAMIVGGAAVMLFGFGQAQHATGISNLWQHGGFMPNGIGGVVASLAVVMFAFGGIEIIGITASEAKDPAKVLPKAINAIPARIIVFYVCSMLTIIAVTSWSHISPDSSPFVMLFDRAGLPAAAAVINFVVLTSAMSSANSGVYSSTRMLYSLSMEKHAHGQFRILSRTTAIPIRSLLFSCFCMVAGTLLLVLVPNVMTLFTIVSTVAAILVVYSWGMILVAYLVYRQKRPDLNAASHFKMPGGVAMAWLTLAFFAFTLVLMVFDSDTLIALCSMPLWFTTLGLIWRYRVRDSVARESYVFYRRGAEAE